jgi:hypothetical protein
MDSPLTDNSFFLSGGTEKTNSSLANATSLNGQIKKQTDGSYQVYGVRKPGKYDFSVRLYTLSRLGIRVFMQRGERPRP